MAHPRQRLWLWINTAPREDWPQIDAGPLGIDQKVSADWEPFYLPAVVVTEGQWSTRLGAQHGRSTARRSRRQAGRNAVTLTYDRRDFLGSSGIAAIHRLTEVRIMRSIPGALTSFGCTVALLVLLPAMSFAQSSIAGVV